MGNLPGPVSKLRIIILASLLFSLASQSFVSVQKPASRSRSNVILLTIDTLRADHLGCYGYKQIQTPNIDKLAAAGARFTTVVAQVPMTFPSHCSILTGTYPMFHKVRDNMGYQLEDSKTTLAEILKPNGYQTGAFVGAYILHSRFGLKQGFDFYYDHFEPWKNSGGITDPTQLEHRGEEVMNQAIQWLGGVSQKAPFFAWVHLYDPHDPYEPPEPFKSQYKSRPYDGEIAYVDQQIGRLVSFLHNKELYEKTLIVLTGDHGESFGEHQEFKHGYFIYDTTLLVPLIIKPVAHAFKSIVIPQQVRLVDIAPSLLQLLELPKGEDMQGTGLLGLLLGKQKDLQLEAYSESFYPAQFGGSALYSLRLPNTPGALADVCRLLSDERVNILAMTLEPAGQLRLVVDNHVHAAGVLREHHHQVSERDVIVTSVPNTPGALAPALRLVADANVNVDYAYSGAAESAAMASVVLGVEDAQRAAAAAGI